MDAADHGPQVRQRRQRGLAGLAQQLGGRLGVGLRSASRPARRSCPPRSSGPGRRRGGRARSGVPPRRSGRAISPREALTSSTRCSSCSTREWPRMPRSARARARTRCGSDQPPGHQHRPVEQHQQPPEHAAVEDRADQVRRRGESAAAPAGSRARTRRSPRTTGTRRRATGPGRGARRTGRVTALVPVGGGVAGRDLLVEQRPADPAVQPGQRLGRRDHRPGETKPTQRERRAAPRGATGSPGPGPPGCPSSASPAASPVSRSRSRNAASSTGSGPHARRSARARCPWR